MKITAKMFGVLCAASLVFCAACDNLLGNPGDGDDGDKGTTDLDKDTDKDDEVTYDVGTIVTFMERQYLVTKNCEGAVTTELTSVQSTDLGTYYPNERADAYRKKLLAEYGVTAYVELFDITEDKSKTSDTGDAILHDTYMILQKGKGVCRIEQRRRSTDLFLDKDGKTASERFNEKTNDELRQNYDPNLIITTNTLFETDINKRFQIDYAFVYASEKDSAMNTIDYTDKKYWDYKYERRDYIKVNGNTRPVYAYRERYANLKRTTPETCWDLIHFSANSRFFEFVVVDSGEYRLSVRGEGTVSGSTLESVYKSTLTINSVQYDSSGTLDLQYNVGIKKNGKTPNNFKQPTGIDNDYVKVSPSMIAVEGVSFRVPATITFSVPFDDSSAILNNYTKVTFEPKAKNGGVIYVPKTDNTYTYDFIAQFAKDYQTVFGNGGSSSSPDIDLQPDTDIGTDKTTPRFMFSGNSLRIELEEMATSGFAITADSDASGGTAGKLVDENSRADAIITFPAGNYKGFSVIRAPSPDNDAFYVKFGDDYVRVYADDPPPVGYASTSRTPINLSCNKEVTVRMTILKDNPNRPDKPGETGMFIDYVEFTKVAGQGGDVPSTNAGKADWTGFTMVDSADKLDFTAHSYEYKEVCYAEYEDTSMLETRIAAIEIVSSDEVTFAYKLKTEEYYDDASYNKAKEESKDNPKYSYDDSTRTITKTYSEEDIMQFGELKDMFSLPEDEIDDDRSWIYTDKKLGIKDGIIQMSFTQTYARTDDTSKDTYYITVTLTPQQ